MLVAALAVTVVGFILLVIALALGSAWLAWACIVVCVIGFGLLIADVLGLRRGERAATAPTAEPAEATPAADYPPTVAAEQVTAGEVATTPVETGTAGAEADTGDVADTVANATAGDPAVTGAVADETIGVQDTAVVEDSALGAEAAAAEIAEAEDHSGGEQPKTEQ